MKIGLQANVDLGYIFPNFLASVKLFLEKLVTSLKHIFF